jgi:anaerobic selenocysteine-containing dehydrogenase
MTDVTRRAFIKRTAAGAAGAVAIGALGAGPVAAAARASSPRANADPDERPSSEPIVAYVRVGEPSEVTVMVGHREIVHRDPALVRRLLRAAK